MVKLSFVALVLFCLTGASNGKTILVVSGGDVAVRCEDSESGWDPLRGNSIELKLGNTAHLLVQNFQKKHDQGLYRCGSKEVVLEERPGSKAGTTLLYRAEGQSAHLFCKHLGSGSCWGSWTGISHDGSGKPHLPGTVHGRREDNNISHHIASVKWGDTGMFVCQKTCWGTVTKTSYELIVVNVTVDPQDVYIGGNVTMCCRVSHWMTPGQVCWVKQHSNINSLRFHGHQENCWQGSQQSFCHQVVNVKPGDTSWACVVFYNDALRALVPVQVNVSKHTTTPENATHTTASRVMDSHTFLYTVVVLGLVTLLLVTLTALLLCNRRKGVNMCGDEEDEKYVGDEDALLSHSDSVTYTVVYFRRITAEGLGKGDVSTNPPTDETVNDDEDMETVIYCLLD